MKSFIERVCLFIDDIEISSHAIKRIRDEIPRPRSELYSWDNIEKIKKYFDLIIKQKRRGRMACLDWFTPYLKEWKNPNPKIEIKFSYENWNPSLEEVCAFDAETAIKYLKEIR